MLVYTRLFGFLDRILSSQVTAISDRVRIEDFDSEYLFHEKKVANIEACPTSSLREKCANCMQKAAVLSV